MVTPS